MYHYSLYGMRVTTDLAISQLEPVQPEGNGGDTTQTELSIRAMNTEETAQFRREHGGIRCGSALGREQSFLCNRTLWMNVECGRRLRYHIREGADLGAARTYLLGFGMAMLALQQGKLPFHGSVLVSKAGEALLIAGESGAGKSTLTAELLDRGYRFMADDMTVVELSKEGEIWVYPAYPYMKLCRDAALRRGHPLERLLYIDEKKDKFLVPCAEHFQTEKVRLTQFVLLGILPEEEQTTACPKSVRVERILGADSMLVYKENLFVRHLWKKQDPGTEIWQNCLRMAQKIPVYSVRRPAAGDSTAEVAAEVHKLHSTVLT